MAFCTEPWGCVMGNLGDVFTVNPGDCGPDAQQVTEMLWQIRNPPIPSDVMTAAQIPPAACYVASSDVALVKEIQGAAGLAQTGVVDDATLAAIGTAVNAMQPYQPITANPNPIQMPPVTVTAQPGAGAKAAAGAGGVLLAGLAAWFLLKKGKK